MATMKIKKGDTVKVIAGKDNNKEGKVLSLQQLIPVPVLLQTCSLILLQTCLSSL